LTFIQSISVSFLFDNVFINENNQLIAADRLNRILFVLHSTNPQKYRAPFELILYPHPTSSKINFYISISSIRTVLDSSFKYLLLTNGEYLSGSTTGTTYKNKLIVGAQFDKDILLCQDLF